MFVTTGTRRVRHIGESYFRTKAALVSPVGSFRPGFGSPAVAGRQFNMSPVTLTIIWPAPPAITCGPAFSSSQLNANPNDIISSCEESTGIMIRSVSRNLAALVLGFVVAFSASVASALSQPSATRVVVANLSNTSGPVSRFFDFSVGSDYAGTLIRDGSQNQLQMVTDELGFRYIRFHGIFHDALGTVQVKNGKIVYDWTRIDQLYDDLLARHIRPFVELSFTPDALATSNNSIFYYHANTSHPTPAKWRNLIAAFARHLEQRYGEAEVRRWYFEVWNEPNLSGFWEGGDQKAYFQLYDLTARTLKSVDPELRVGGPATAGASWIPDFLDYVKKTGAPIDFVSTHTYGVDGGFLDADGKSDVKLDSSPEAIVGDVRRARQQIAASPFPHLPLFFTEWSTSYTPADPVHDSYISAPYILSKLKAADGLAQGMSYWTYSDLFEEAGPPRRPSTEDSVWSHMTGFANRPFSRTSICTRSRARRCPPLIHSRCSPRRAGISRLCFGISSSPCK